MAGGGAPGGLPLTGLEILPGAFDFPGFQAASLEGDRLRPMAPRLACSREQEPSSSSARKAVFWLMRYLPQSDLCRCTSCICRYWASLTMLERYYTPCR